MELLLDDEWEKKKKNKGLIFFFFLTLFFLDMCWKRSGINCWFLTRLGSPGPTYWTT